MLKKCDCWPKVLVNDDGIRPAGKPDQCFYCQSYVGQEHDKECVTVLQIVKYKVYMNLDRRSTESNRGIEVGTFTRPDPHFWSSHDCEFHKNDSSWCADNALDTIVWNDEKYDKQLEEHINQYGGCACTPLRFEYDECVDGSPLIEVEDESDDTEDKPITIFLPEDK